MLQGKLVICRQIHRTCHYVQVSIKDFNIRPETLKPYREEQGIHWRQQA
jgi:hypothetical protein